MWPGLYRAMIRVVGPGEGAYFRTLLAALLVFVITTQVVYVAFLVHEPRLFRLTAPVTLASAVVQRGDHLSYSLSYCLTKKKTDHLVMAVFRPTQERTHQPHVAPVYVEAQPWFVTGCHTVAVLADVPMELEPGTYHLDVRRVWLTPLSIASRIFEVRYETPEFRVE